MAPDVFLTSVVVPGLQFMTKVLGNIPGRDVPWESDDQGRLLELCFSGQETRWTDEQQIGGGPGRGPWQFEPPTCGLILRNPASAAMAHAICAAAGIEPTQAAVYAALLAEPVKIALPFARLDTWCDFRPLAAYGDVQAGWLMYDEEWEPGKPHPETWADIYARSLAADKVWCASVSH